VLSPSTHLELRRIWLLHLIGTAAELLVVLMIVSTVSKLHLLDPPHALLLAQYLMVSCIGDMHVLSNLHSKHLQNTLGNLKSAQLPPNQPPVRHLEVHQDGDLALK